MYPVLLMIVAPLLALLVLAAIIRVAGPIIRPPMGRPRCTSSLGRFGRAVGYSSLVILPLALVVGGEIAFWPYNRGFPPTVGPPRWDLLATITGGGLAIAFLLGQLVWAVLPEGGRSQKDGTLPPVGPRWSDRLDPRTGSEGVRPAEIGFVEPRGDAEVDPGDG